MQSLTFEQIGLFVVAFIVIGGVAISIKDSGKKQAEQFNALTTTFNESLAKLNTSVQELNITLSFIKKDAEKQNDRMTTHGKEIDELSTRTTINKVTLDRHEKRLDILENKTLNK